MRNTEVANRIYLTLIFLHKLALRFVLIGKIGKVNRFPGRRYRWVKAQAGEVPWHQLMMLRITGRVMETQGKVIIMRLAGGLGQSRVVLGMVAAVELLWVLLRCSTCLVRCLKCKIARCRARTVGHWLHRRSLRIERQKASVKAGFGPLKGREFGVADEELSKSSLAWVACGIDTQFGLASRAMEFGVNLGESEGQQNINSKQHCWFMKTLYMASSHRWKIAQTMRLRLRLTQLVA
jgi:hypothetical protein